MGNQFSEYLDFGCFAREHTKKLVDAPAGGAEPSRAGLEPTVPDERLITTRVGATSKGKGSPKGEQSQQEIPPSPPAEADRPVDQINHAFNSASPQPTLEKVTAASDADIEGVSHQLKLHQQTLTLARSEVQEIGKEVEENEKQSCAMAEAEDWAGAEALGERVAELKLRPAASAGGADAETKPAEEETKPAEEIDAAALGAVGQVVTASCSGGGSGRSSCVEASDSALKGNNSSEKSWDTSAAPYEPNAANFYTSSPVSRSFVAVDVDAGCALSEAAAQIAQKQGGDDDKKKKKKDENAEGKKVKKHGVTSSKKMHTSSACGE